ncbi:MAG: ABC transporter ATP-binding protein [Pseudorhodobacter sp.]
MANLDIRTVTKRYGDLTILRDINLSVGDGEFLVLVGPSGCGKSTLLNCIAGLTPISDGTILIGDRDVSRLEPRERDIAMVFQSYALYPSMTVGENMAFPLRMGGMGKQERLANARRVAEQLQIDHLFDRRPGQLSGGQRQRVAMGRALVRDPDVFLFDEPLSNLDAKLRVDMRTEIKKLHARVKTTTVYVTHDQVEAMTLATRIAVMKDGIVQQFGTPDEIYSAPVNIFVATFMGSPAMNMLTAHLTPDNRLDFGGETIPCPAPAGSLPVGEIKVGIRPEQIVLNPARDGLAATVEVVEPTGPETFVVMRLGEYEITARLSAGCQLHEGERITIGVDPERLVLFDAKSETRIETKAL